jgi:hypothetical protein
MNAVTPRRRGTQPSFKHYKATLPCLSVVYVSVDAVYGCMRLCDETGCNTAIPARVRSWRFIQDADMNMARGENSSCQSQQGSVELAKIDRCKVLQNL